MTIEQIIARFGGTSRTAERFGVTPPAVSNWKAFNQFPARLHLRIIQEAKREGFTIPMRIFEQDRA